MAAVPVPVRASVRDLLGDLVGKAVQIAPGEEARLEPERPSYAATYRFDDGRVAAVAVCDLSAALSLGAAIGFMGKGDAEAELEQHDGVLGGDLLDFFREVVNVLAKLLNSPTSPHVALREVDHVPGHVRADTARIALRPRERADYELTVEGFEPGHLTVLAA